jgi:hypothetical protein
MGYEYDIGFRDAVESLVKAIDSGEKVVLGNGAAFVGLSMSEPMTIVGNSTIVMNSLFTEGKKTKYPDPRAKVTIKTKL